MSRDDFSSLVKRDLAGRVNSCCSNPSCHAQTAGPDASEGTVNVGVAAHITAASVGGPRFDSSLSPPQRVSIANAIWLCQICAHRIDVDPDAHPVTLLQAWKVTSEHQAAQALGKPLPQPGESEAARKLRALLPLIGKVVTYAELAAPGREQLVRGRYRTKQSAVVISWNEYHVTLRAASYERSVPLERLVISRDDQAGRPELQERPL